MDAPHAARSGHQGTAMALAPLAHVLWTRIMRYDPAAPDWADRDRFILSCGHASILQYAMLHLTGYELSLDDLREFRQWGSATPGHPEAGHTAGIEVTTGPLGQGFANGVGMAIAEQSLRARFGADVVDHHIYAMVSDGDLSEGVSHEAASLAGHLGLGRLVYVYDDNHISIDGPTELALTDDAVGRFESYGWQVIQLGEASEDLDAMEAALREARDTEDRPSLIVVRSHIGFPSPDHVDTAAAHGLAFDGGVDPPDQGGHGSARRALLRARRRGCVLPRGRPAGCPRACRLGAACTRRPRRPRGGVGRHPRAVVGCPAGSRRCPPSRWATPRPPAWRRSRSSMPSSARSPASSPAAPT